MKRTYRKYAPYLILLDATYRTTKYPLPLYFLVVKTNVNYQVRPYFSLISLYILLRLITVTDNQQTLLILRSKRIVDSKKER